MVPNHDNAVKLLTDFTSDSAQSYFANGNNEYPVVPSVAASSVVEGLGEFTADTPLRAAVLAGQRARVERYTARDLPAELRQHLSPLLAG